MSLLEQLRKENMQAMKDKDVEKRGTCTLLMSGLILAEKEKKEALTNEEELAVVAKELKQTRETLEMTPAERDDSLNQTKRKSDSLESYLPKQLNEEEIKDAVEEILKENNLEPLRKNQGTIMKTFMAKYKGSADGKMVATVLGKILK